MKNNTTNLEPILTHNKGRFVLFPIQYPEIWKMYKQAEASFWTAEEIDLSVDIADWNNLTEGERGLVRHCLGFLAVSDGIVNENLASRFIQEIQIAEAKCFMGFQMSIGNIHSEIYSLLIETYSQNQEEKNHIFNAIDTIPGVTKKAEWALQWIEGNHSFGTRLLAFAAFESIFLSSSFCAISWLKKRDLLPGLCFSNELICRDESLHRDFACLLFSMLNQKPDEKEARDIITGAVAIEKEFILEPLSNPIQGMNAKEMSGYIEFVADQLLVSLGYSKAYGTPNPFPWMDLGSLHGKSQFFGKHLSETPESNAVPRREEVLSFEEDF